MIECGAKLSSFLKERYRAPNLIEIERLLLGLTIQIDNFASSQLFAIACIF